jgi:hypothetical protein
LNKTSRRLTPIDGTVGGIGRQHNIGRQTLAIDRVDGTCRLVLSNDFGLDGAGMNAEAVEDGAHPLRNLNVVFAVRQKYVSRRDDLGL